MTCIAGVVEPDGSVYLAGDSAGTGGGDQLILATSKVFRRDDFIFGYAGEFRFGQVLRYHLKLPLYRGGADGDVTEFMVREFVPALRHACHEAGFLSRDDGGRDQGGWGIVGFHGHLFRIQEGFDLLETADGIDAIGSGGTYALAVLQAIRANPDPVMRLGEALRITQMYHSMVRGPFQYVKLEKAIDARARTRRSRAPNRRHPRRHDPPRSPRRARKRSSRRATRLT